MIRWGQAPFGTVELDTTDRRILKLLRPNARRSYASIAREIGVSEPTVRNRVDRLIKRGAILPWTGVNPAAIARSRAAVRIASSRRAPIPVR